MLNRIWCFRFWLVYFLLSAYFSLFIASNIVDFIKYSHASNKWNPSPSEGALLYQVSKTNPSSFSRENIDAMYLLYFLGSKKVYVNSLKAHDDLKLYYKVYCRFGVKGNVSYNGYDYSCSNLLLDSVLESAPMKCEFPTIYSSFKAMSVCDSGVPDSEAVNLIINDAGIVISSRMVK